MSDTMWYIIPNYISEEIAQRVTSFAENNPDIDVDIEGAKKNLRDLWAQTGEIGTLARKRPQEANDE